MVYDIMITYPSRAAEHLDVKGIPHELVVDDGEGVACCHGKEEWSVAEL